MDIRGTQYVKIFECRSDEKHCILVGKPERKRTFGRTWHTWENNIRMDLTEIEWGVMGWIYLA
jgi:hypothetical protein